MEKWYPYAYGAMLLVVLGLVVAKLFMIVFKKDEHEQPDDHHAPAHVAPKPSTAPAAGHQAVGHGDQGHGHQKGFGGKLVDLLFWAVALVVICFVAFWLWGVGGRSLFLEATGQQVHATNAYQPMNGPRSEPGATTSAPTAPAAEVIKLRVYVKPFSEGYSDPALLPDDGVRRTFCRDKNPDRDGYDVQYRDSRYTDLADEHFYDGPPKGDATAERYRSTDEEGFWMTVWLVPEAQGCTNLT